MEITKQQRDNVLIYIRKNSASSIGVEFVPELNLDQFQANQIMVDLVQLEYITATNGLPQITVIGNNYLKTISR